MKINRKLSEFRYLLFAFLLLLPVMIILSFYSVETYSIIKNTTSHLGAQGTTNAWIMNTAFILAALRAYWKPGCI